LYWWTGRHDAAEAAAARAIAVLEPDGASRELALAYSNQGDWGRLLVDQLLFGGGHGGEACACAPVRLLVCAGFDMDFRPVSVPAALFPAGVFAVRRVRLARVAGLAAAWSSSPAGVPALVASRTALVTSNRFATAGLLCLVGAGGDVDA
jgi:hypothetical protein